MNFNSPFVLKTAHTQTNPAACQNSKKCKKRASAFECVCVRERERERVFERYRQIKIVCLFERERERESERERVCVFERDRKSVFLNVSCRNDREKNDTVYVCV